MSSDPKADGCATWVVIILFIVIPLYFFLNALHEEGNLGKLFCLVLFAVIVWLLAKNFYKKEE